MRWDHALLDDARCDDLRRQYGDDARLLAALEVAWREIEAVRAAARASRRRSLESRFWSHVEKRSGRAWNGTECWEWRASCTPEGYGKFKVGGRDAYAHRFSYELARGPIPARLTVDHLCRCRRCVNPDHLEAVTARVNILRGENPAARNARKSHCRAGHELTPENVHTPAGTHHRVCRLCERERGRERLARRRQALRTS